MSLEKKINTKKEKMLSDFLPYSSFVDLNTIKTFDSSYLRVIKVQGVAFESADDFKINSWNNQLNSALKSIASPNVAVWSHIVRKRTKLFPRGDFKKGSFADSFNEKYKLAMTKEKLYINELYLSVIYRDVEEGKINGIVDMLKNILSKKNKEDILIEQKKSLEKLNQITSTVISSLSEFNPVLLGAYTLKKTIKFIDGEKSIFFNEEPLKDIRKLKNETIYSEVLEFLSYVLNGDKERIKMPNGEVNKYLPSSKIIFRDDSGILIQKNNEDIFGAMLGITAYQDYTTPIMLVDLLDVDFEFVISQSLTFINRINAMSKIKMQFDRMDATEDVGITQQEELLNAMDDLQSHKFEMGNYSFSMFVKSESLSNLKDNIAEAGSILMNGGIRWAIEDKASMASYLSMLPSNFIYRPRISLITTLNFSSFAPLFSYPIGNYKGNQWGDAVTMFKTLSDSPFYFNFHASNILDTNISDNINEEFEENKDSEDEEFELANTMVLGQSGAGKTVLQGVLLAQSQKFDTEENPCTYICTDSERGLSISVKAMGGVCFDISPENKNQTFNPLMLPYSNKNVSFIVELIKVLVEDDYYKITPTTEELLSSEISQILKMDNLNVKRLSQLRTYLDKSEKDGIYKRLSKWCEGGIYGWVFDNPVDNFDITKEKIMCFEMSSFLNNDEIKLPISMYFFHKLEALLTNKDRFIIFLDEFWQLLDDDYFVEKIKGLMKRVRKQNGFLVMFTQEPEDFLNSKISNTLVSQCATQIFLPNEKAKKESYMKLGVSEAEFDLIKSLHAKSRRFLIRQGGGSVLAELNLAGFNKELAVFSANTKTMSIVDSLEKKYGSDPEKWLPVFYNYLDGGTLDV